ncbi:MAG: hypothetical protein M3Y87_14820 [Myxococcota bacterium]|nr:hypothetical protein [Myxococcota bacterium]
MKHGSRLHSSVAFTIALAILVAITPAIARADRVVLYPVTGRADPDRLEEVEDHVADALRALGHEVVAPPGGISSEPPSTAAQMGGVATASGASYVVIAEIEPLRAQYRLHVRVGYQATERVEELVVTVMAAEEEARLRDVLAAMLRPEGLGDDAVRLTGEPDPAADEAERLRREDEERARQQAADEEAAREEAERAAREAEEARTAEERAQREEAERAAREREAWNARATYGSDGEWLLLIGGEASYAFGFSQRTVRLPDGTMEQRDTGGGLGLIQARVGRAFSGTDGLELRGGIDVVLGAFGGMNIVLGGVWQFSPFTFPIRIGVTIELGGSFTFTGARDAGFLVRGGAVASWAPIRQLQIELALPEIGVITNGAGAFLIGAAVRVGYRF